MLTTSNGSTEGQPLDPNGGLANGVSFANGKANGHAPGAVEAVSDVPWEGRDRMDMSGYSPPPFSVQETEHMLMLRTRQISLEVRTPLSELARVSLARDQSVRILLHLP
jgi:hypothetical protein